MKRPCVMAVCGDPGGGNAVAPVVELLRREGRVEVVALAYRQTREVWARRALAFEALDEGTSVAQVEALIGERRANLVLTGTSDNSVDLEKRFIEAARRVSVPSLAVLDFWANYRARFSGPQGALTAVPDRIAVMDERARDEMLGEGFKEQTLVITGQPALEDLGKWRLKFPPARKDEIRKRLGVKPEDVMVLFASQPLAGRDALEEKDPTYRGYTEKTVLPKAAACLQRIGKRIGKDVVLVIQPHPREDAAGFGRMEWGGLKVRVAAPEEPYDLALAADVVSGMNSIFLMEAAILGCVAVSLQPGLRVKDKLPSNLNGLTVPVYREEEMESVLERLMVRGKPGEEKGGGEGYVKGATQRVVSLAYAMIGEEVDSIVQAKPERFS